MTMKTIIIQTLTIWAMFYGLFAFVNWELNPGCWQEWSRALFTGICIGQFLRKKI